MKVTYRQLTNLGACKDQLALVAIMWGESVEVNAQSCAEAADLGLDVNWAADHLLTDEQLEQYEAIRQRAWKQYGAIRQRAREQYGATCWQAIANVTA